MVKNAFALAALCGRLSLGRSMSVAAGSSSDKNSAPVKAEEAGPLAQSRGAEPGVSAAKAPSGELQHSLVRRLTRLNLQVLSSAMVLSFGLIAAILWLGARERQAQAAELSAQLLANSLAPMLVFEDQAAANAELAAFVRRGEVLEVRALNAGLKVFVQWQASPSTSTVSASSMAASAAAAALPTGLGHAQGLRLMRAAEVEVWVPIRLKGELVGSLVLRESLQSLQLLLLKLISAAALLIAVAIVIAWRALRRVQQRALAPIVELSRLAEQVSVDQDFTRRATVHWPDEVGRLSERFNQMLQRVETTQAELNLRLRQEQEAGQQFEQLAHRDALTQLPNRLYFQSALERHMAVSCQNVELMALMFIDLDNFKTVNDKHGHEAGDEVLREVARRMSRVLRGNDVLCRLGGDEFGLILPALPNDTAAEQLAVRLIAAVREPLYVGEHLMPIGATVGLAFCPTDEVDAAHLLVAADVAMYAAKRAGKNTFRRASHASS